MRRVQGAGHQVPIRTTAEGTAVPDGGFATKGDLNAQALFTGPASLGMPEGFRLN
ncbi:fragment of adenylyl-sulfate reductase, beta subunit [Candidatus Sulfopaludibacter sp. SbA6]|nr:fragment of adenylyl-sulfate reductase, beta subunit [Candidatus Sulfopaludibacter sp. SbA6]